MPSAEPRRLRALNRISAGLTRPPLGSSQDLWRGYCHHPHVAQRKNGARLDEAVFAVFLVAVFDGDFALLAGAFATVFLVAEVLAAVFGAADLRTGAFFAVAFAGVLAMCIPFRRYPVGNECPIIP